MRKEYKKLLANTGFLAMGSFASSLLSMLLVPFYTAVLSTQDYGVSDLITTTTSLLYPLMTIAISEAIMRFTLDQETDKKSVYSVGIGIVTVGFILVLCGTLLVNNSVLNHYKGFFLLYYLLYCLHTVTSYFVKGLEKVRMYSFSGLLHSATVIFCNLLFLLVFRWGIEGYLLSSVLGHAVAVVYMFCGAKLYRYLVPPRSIDWSLIRRMVMYSIPIIPNSISWWIANSSDKYILNYYADVSQVGIYAVSYKIPSIVMTIMGFFISAWQLSVVENFGTEQSKRLFSEIYEKYIACNVLIAAGLICVAKPFGAFLYSADFFEAWRYVPVLIIANIFNSLASFLGTIYTSSKKTKMLSISTMTGAGTNIVMNFLLIPVIGAMGAAVATAASYLLMWIIRLVNTRKILPFNVNYKKDAVMLAFLFAEAVLVCMDTLLSQAIAAVILLLLILFYRQFAEALAKQVFALVVSKFKKQR